MKVYIARHGETNENAQGIVQGWLDTELNENGISQAIAAARNFNKPVQVIYSSDLKRAVRTAEEFRGKYPKVPYIEDARLRERNFGDAAGTHRNDHDREQFWANEKEVTISNAESLVDFTQRVNDFLLDLKTKNYNSVLVVAHGGVLNRVQSILDPGHTHVPHANASILEICL